MSIQEFDGLRKKLSENKNWPINYMFKFIAPNKDGKVDKVKAILPQEGKFSYKNTKNLRHVSITCIAKMNSVDDIIYIMKMAKQVEGVMCL